VKRAVWLLVAVIRASAAWYTYWFAINHPLSGRNGRRPLRSRNGSVVNRCTQRGASNSVSIQTPRPVLGTPEIQIAKNAEPSAGSANE
jgi:hypothetical protein